MMSPTSMGAFMSHKLNHTDRHAVDLLLDGGQDVGEPGKPPLVHPARIGPAPVQSLEKILSTLQTLPAVDPPPDLLAKTLAHIERVSHVAARPSRHNHAAAPPA